MNALQRRRTKLAVWAVIPLLALGIAGCGTQQNKEADGGKPRAEQSIQDWQVSYASCMRQEGVDVPDPGKDGNQAVPATEDSPLQIAANKTCLEKIGEPPVGDKETSPEEVGEGALDTNKCLRENGVDVKDPAAGEMTVLPDVSQDILDKCGLVGVPAG